MTMASYPAITRRKCPLSVLCSRAYLPRKCRKIKDSAQKWLLKIDWEAAVLPLNYARECRLLRFWLSFSALEKKARQIRATTRADQAGAVILRTLKA